ncbi:MAG: cupredoxin domain-containing protein [Nitrososphaerales archaeon]|nr:cupredoxin domain-containing protein [Nitrososphaerales archaeon]
MRSASKRAMSGAGVALIVLILVSAVFAIVYVDTVQGNGDQIARLQTQIQQLSSDQSALKASLSTLNKSLPVINQAPTIRQIRETWYLSPAAHQDRFEPSFISVNQGDQVQLTLIDNDTVAHDLVIGPPYNIVVNATVPGMINDLTGQEFKTPAKNNSPGVTVSGTPGSVSATYSFVAKYPGIFEFVCTYHAQVGMIGYLVVLPNAAFTTIAPAGQLATNPGALKVSIVPGAGSNTTSKGYSPNAVTLVIGADNTITWINNDNAPHTVTADDGSFTSGNIAPGASFSFTFTKAGTFGYHCVYHPWMTGTVIVKA